MVGASNVDRGVMGRGPDGRRSEPSARRRAVDGVCGLNVVAPSALRYPRPGPALLAFPSPLK